MRARPGPLSLAAIALTLVVACTSDDGRALRPASPEQTAAPSGTQPAIVEVFSLSSAAFENGAAIPKSNTCAGNVSPDLAWASTPAAAELALVVRDRDADGYVHWVATGIDPSLQGFARGEVPDGVVQGRNSTGTTGWFGPCPPRGTGTHTYEFAMHALAEPLTLSPDLEAADAAAAVEAASIGRAVLTGTVKS